MMNEQQKPSREKRRDPYRQVRKSWSRNPVEEAHSTKKGARGYDRKRAHEETLELIEEMEDEKG